MIRNIIITIFIINMSSLISYSQNDNRWCIANDGVEEKYNTDPIFRAKEDEYKKLIDEKVKEINTSKKKRTTYYIPIVYHVAYTNPWDSISEDQILSDLVMVNKYYSKTNNSVNSINSAFTGIAANVDIKFILAKKKPNGTCFNGITYTYSNATTDNGHLAKIKQNQGNFLGNKYLNIFVLPKIQSGENVLGYTYLPGTFYGDDMENGIRVRHTALGLNGTANLDLGVTGENATTAHEIGHWLNLYHTWGSGNDAGNASNCGNSDYVDDTPETIGNVTCNVNAYSCGSLDNVENIMEYSFCEKMFTNGQKNRMIAALTTSSVFVHRNDLYTTSNHIYTGIFNSTSLCNADFKVKDNNVSCAYHQVKFEDKSMFSADTWYWEFENGYPASSTEQNPTITYYTPGNYDVKLKVKKGNDSLSILKTDYLKIINPGLIDLEFNDDFETLNFDDYYTTYSKHNGNLFEKNNLASVSGSYSLFVGNNSNPKFATSSLQTKPIDLKHHLYPKLKFKYSYAYNNIEDGDLYGNEKVYVYFSNNCGAEWTKVYTLNRSTNNYYTSSFIPLSTQWKDISINIPSLFLTDGFMVKFEIFKTNGNNFYLENININSNNVGIDNINDDKNINVFPNPMTNNSNIQIFSDKSTDINIYITDVVGKIIKNLDINKIVEGENNIEIYKENLNSGNYFIIFELDNKIITKQLIIN